MLKPAQKTAGNIECFGGGQGGQAGHGSSRNIPELDECCSRGLFDCITFR